MFDSHCHLDLSPLMDNSAQVLTQAQLAGVSGLMVPGVDEHSLARLKIIQQRHSAAEFQLRFALGLHPCFLTQAVNSQLEQIQQQLTQLPISAIGETGLDKTQPHWPQQIQSLKQHLHWAEQLNLPIILHHRRSMNELYAIVKDYPKVTGVLHAFSGSLQQAKQWVELGYYLGVGGTITYPRATKTQASIRQLGIKQLLLETDAPSMPISGQQGHANNPANLAVIAQCLAKLTQLPLQTIQQQCTDNALSLFKGCT